MRGNRDGVVGRGCPARGDRGRVAGAVLAGVVLAAATAGCGALTLPADASTPSATASGSTAPGSAASGSTASPAGGGTAAAALAALPVKGRAPMTGYTRTQFGPAWADVDHDGCDQRNQILRRDLTAATFRPASRPCVVLAGTLVDAYTGVTVRFTRGPGTSDQVQIDHVVPLAEAWQTGAQALDAATRAQLAGDPLNLQAVEGAVNQSKGDGDAATWLPPARSYRCAYVARQVAVKTVYRLWVTTAEGDAITQVLRACPGQPLPSSGLPKAS